MRPDFRLTDLLAHLRLFSRKLPVSVRGFDTATAGRLLNRRTPVIRRLSRPTQWAVSKPRPTSTSLFAVPWRQVNETTCGSAVLVMLQMLGDPAYAAEIQADPDSKWPAAQLAMKRSTSVTFPPWPSALGTPPWSLARRARFGETRYVHRVMGTSTAKTRERSLNTLAAALAAVHAGTSVPLFTGGDRSSGWKRAVPRHVVLLTASEAGESGVLLSIYEPSSGNLHQVPLSTFLAPFGANPPAKPDPILRRALGGWPHVVWAVLPKRT